MLKVVGFSYIPRCCSFLCLYSVWVLGSFTLFVLVVTPFPGKDCYLYELQNYNDVETINTFNKEVDFCSYSTITFKYKDDYERVNICVFCNEFEDSHQKRDKCVEEFYGDNDIEGFSMDTDIDVEMRKHFTCRSGYNDNFVIEKGEFHMMVVERMIFLILFFVYLVIPFFSIFIVCGTLYFFYQECFSVIPTFICGYCYCCRKKNKDGYNQMYDPGSQYVPTHFVDNNIKPFFHWDPVYIQMKRTWKWYEAECVHWVDRSTKYISKWERRYFTIAGLVCFAAVTVMFVLLVEKVFVMYLPGILVDVVAPFINIFVTWNAIIFIFYVVYKISIIRVITNKRAIKFFRVPLFGLIMQYVLFKDCDNVIEVQNWIYVENKDTNRKVCVFRTGSPISCTTAIREFIERERRFREREAEIIQEEEARQEEENRVREERRIERDRLRQEVEERERELEELRRRAREQAGADLEEEEEREDREAEGDSSSSSSSSSGGEEEEEGITSEDDLEEGTGSSVSEEEEGESSSSDGES